MDGWMGALLGFVLGIGLFGLGPYLLDGMETWDGWDGYLEGYLG